MTSSLITQGQQSYQGDNMALKHLNKHALHSKQPTLNHVRKSNQNHVHMIMHDLPYLLHCTIAPLLIGQECIDPL